MVDGITGYLKLLTAYNTWANIKISKFVESAGEEKSLLIQKSSFPSINQTILHIWNAQTIWYSRLSGISPVQWPAQPFNGTTLTACKSLVDSSKDFETLVSNFNDEELQRPILYKNLKSVEFSSSVLQIIAHVMNHGTFHRGQLITLFRGAGFTELESTDMIAFFREIKR